MLLSVQNKKHFNYLNSSINVKKYFFISVSLVYELCFTSVNDSAEQSI